MFTDTVSGALDSRPQLDKLREQLRPGDTVVAWRLDRLGRSIRHLIDVMSEFEEQGVGFRSLTENIDTTSPGGRLIFHVFAALAGLEAARARGRQAGRPSSLSDDQVSTARRLYAQKDMTVAQISKVLGVSRSTVYRVLGQGSRIGPTLDDRRLG